MAKKYLSLEEAAKEAGISPDALKHLRERGEIRGFSDGGTWKFKADDIEELVRSRQTDSNPDVPLLTDDEDLETGSSILGIEEEEDLVSEQPTVIRGHHALDDDDDDALLVGMSSDSDVRLIPNELLTDVGGGEEPTMSMMGDSDSDVRLVDSSPLLSDPASDSDVKFVSGSDSDVKLVGGSDSDVRFVEEDSDSDVQLVGANAATDRDIPTLEDSDSDVALVSPGLSLDDDGTEGSVFDDESGVSISGGSSILLAAESGISLEDLGSKAGLEKNKPKSDLNLGSDSDLSLNPDDSGISLEGFDDSDPSLDDDSDDGFVGLADDSGIELSPADSGIALESLMDSGIALDDADNRTMPMLKSAGLEDLDDTAMEVPTLENDSEFELSMESRGKGDTTNVIMFDDDEEIDDRTATVVRPSAGAASEEFDLTGDGGFDLEDSFEEFDEDADFDAGSLGDDLDVVDDVVGEDDELDDLDVFDEGADDFDDEFVSGQSHAEFVAPSNVGGQMVAVQQADWGTGPFVGLMLSTILMVVCGMMMFDLVRSMWSWNDPSGFNSPLLGIVRDMLKN